MPTARQLANLRPARPGDVRNPNGKNGHLARREAAKLFDQLLLSLKDGTTPLEAILDRVLADAARGRPHALKMVLDRLLPITQSVALELPEAPRSPGFVPSEEEERELGKMLREGGVVS